MRKSFAFIALLMCVGTVVHAQVVKPAIIPQPVEISYKKGTFAYEQIPVKAVGFTNYPTYLVEFAREVVAQAQPTAQPNYRGLLAATTGLVLQVDKNTGLPEEGYRLVVNEQGISIVSPTERGVFWGLQTLLQLMPEEGQLKEIPFVEISDYPRFRYRGLHLDVCRYFLPIEFVKRYIDLIAYYKLNTFHWHLTEDQGWRIEIKKYPKLTEIGGYRDQTIIGYHKDKPQRFDGTRYGGFYTQDEIKEVVAYATKKNITVIPEIELPGHALAALAAYPELGCGDNPGPYKTSQTWGIFPDVFCAGKETTFAFLQDVLDEVLELFPSEYIHIGGDECPKTRWKECPHCQKRIKKEKLKDEHELQSYFITRIEKYLNKKGRQIIGWDEILEGGLAPNATVMSWRGVKGGIAAAQQHHDVIMTPNIYMYLDYRESTSKEEPLTQGRWLPLEKTYSYDPASPDELTPEQQKYIKGVQANMWLEFLNTPEKVWYKLFPRMLALSEVAWTPVAKKDWTSFSEERVPVHLANLEKQGITYRVPTPIGLKDTTIVASSYTFSCKVPVKGAKVHYTIDGYQPTELEPVYTQPFTLTIPEGQERVIKAVTVAANGRRSVTITTKIVNEAVKP